MNQDELDELFGEEDTVVENSLAAEVIYYSEPESDIQDNKEKSDDESEDEEFMKEDETTSEINDLNLASVLKPSSQGLIVIQNEISSDTLLFSIPLF
jgi:hypothetical protein